MGRRRRCTFRIRSTMALIPLTFLGRFYRSRRRDWCLRMGPTGWSDLGHPERVMAVLRAAGLEPWWVKKWTALTRDLPTEFV